MNFLAKMKNFFVNRALGFYFTAAALILSFVQMLIYAVSFQATAYVSYYHWGTTLFAVLGIAAGTVLSLFKQTENFAAPAITLGALLSFGMFARYGYMYFTMIFYGGISAQAIFGMYYGFLGSIILYILTFGVGVAAIFLLQSKRVEPVSGLNSEGKVVPELNEEEKENVV